MTGDKLSSIRHHGVAMPEGFIDIDRDRALRASARIWPDQETDEGGIDRDYYNLIGWDLEINDRIESYDGKVGVVEKFIADTNIDHETYGRGTSVLEIVVKYEDERKIAAGVPHFVLHSASPVRRIA